MNKKLSRILIYILPLVFLPGVIACCMSCSRAQSADVSQANLHEVVSIMPDTAYAKGVSGCFAGSVKDYILIAGGCNFPAIPAAEGGQKIFYRQIYKGALHSDTIVWNKVGELPYDIAYGATVSNGKELILIGGKTVGKAIRDVWRMRLNKEGQAILDSLPPLPFTFDNGSASLYKGYIYVVAGNQDDVPSKATWRLDLNKMQAGWRRLSDLPGKTRVQPVSAVCDSRLFVMGGFDGGNGSLPPTLSLDAYSLDLSVGDSSQTWQVVPAPTNQDTLVSVGGGCAVTTGHNILCFGGVNKDIFMEALDRIYKLQTDSVNVSNLDSLKEVQSIYLKHPVSWYRFNPYLLAYKAQSATWKTCAHDAHKLSRAGATAVKIDDHNILVINGEIKPGIRTPMIVRISIP